MGAIVHIPPAAGSWVWVPSPAPNITPGSTPHPRHTHLTSNGTPKAAPVQSARLTTTHSPSATNHPVIGTLVAVTGTSPGLCLLSTLHPDRAPRPHWHTPSSAHQDIPRLSCWVLPGASPQPARTCRHSPPRGRSCLRPLLQGWVRQPIHIIHRNKHRRSN